MTDRTALIASILGNPQEDTPRLVYADWMEEQGEVERAEFVRCQVELSVIGDFDFTDRNRQLGHQCHADKTREELRRRERELLNRHHRQWFHRCGEMDFPEWHRGFISSVRLPWDGPGGWLRHHERLYWAVGQTVECPECRGRGTSTANPHSWEWDNCVPCKSTGRIPRPLTDDLAATCQPLEEVRLTTWPGGTMDGFLDPDTWLADSYCFTREKCQRCKGRRDWRDALTGDGRCHDCHGTPPNRWTCDAWPGLVFVMPEA